MTRTGMRLGSAATRDSISFGRTGEADRHGDGKSKKLPAVQGPANPLGDSIQNALIYGSSQSGRWIRTFIQLGFNEDENHREVGRSEERRVGKECRSRWSPDH